MCVPVHVYMYAVYIILFVVNICISLEQVVRQISQDCDKEEVKRRNREGKRKRLSL